MACIDYATWQQAARACQNLNASVKGFGYTLAGLQGLRSLGVDPVSLNIPAPDSSDPCAIAQQTPCPPPARTAPHALTEFSCVTSPNAITCQPGGALFCKDHPADPSCVPGTPGAHAAASVTAGGFHQLGLLAAVVVGGLVVYQVTRKKS
jgi:hypothetical protein